MTTKQFRILGAFIVLFFLVLCGEYNANGIVLILSTVGVAVFFEEVIIKKYATDSKGKTNTHHEP